MSIFSERLRSKRKELNLTMDDICSKLEHIYGYKTNKSIISKYENDAHTPNFYFVDLVSRILNVSTDWLIGRSDYEILPNSDYLVRSHIPSLLMNDDSMINARIEKGDTLYIEPIVDNDFDGSIIAYKNANIITIRRVNIINNNYLLSPENSNYEKLMFTNDEFSELEIIGKVLYVRFEVK